MKIIPYGRQHIDKKDIKAVVDVLKSDWITQGPKIAGFEKALAEYAGAKYVITTSSGTAALHIACLAGGIRTGDEVITSPITFIASANCILYCGGKAVFADIQEDTVNINPDKIEKHINERTRAIIPVHFAGHPADLEEIQNIARKHNLIVIEDAAHALGAEYKDSKIGSCRYSDMTVFSFHPVKSITTAEGGAVLTNRKDLYDKLLMLRNHGITKDDSRFRNYDSRPGDPWYYEMQYLGFNYRVTDLQCALGISQLKKIDKFLNKRRAIAKRYNTGFKDIKDFIELPDYDYPDKKSAWHLYVIKLCLEKLKPSSCRKKIFIELFNKNIRAQVHYIPLYMHLYYAGRGYGGIKLINAERYYSRCISLPIYFNLTCNQQDYVIRNVKTIVSKYRKNR